MADALAAADLAICRAGAATMAELPVAGTPAILVPGEFSAQESNARALAAHGAAHVILNRDLTAKRLAAETLALLADRERLAAMAAACPALADGDAAGRVATMVREVAGHA
jgi:UDP-N-acetylglucosamine--N-acetylmuramyl-(pentapeptide) pyrophosphoryl-undecaprenol N-acetylglucosamine transferase